jgi:hypothetical protein
MKLYRITMIGQARVHYAIRNGVFAGRPLIAWVPRKASAALFLRKDAADLARRMRRLRIRTKIEAV